MDETNKIGIIILAAGESKRLGRPKQLLDFHGKTLIEKITETALETELKTVVVLGANAEKIKPVIENLSVEIVINENWQSGMSSSIIKGLKKSLEIQNDLQSVILLLGDQPLITKEIIWEIIKTQKVTNKAIIASKYAETIGVPALFTKAIFDKLLNLNEEIGAKLIIKKHSGIDVATISVPEAEFDIDTEDDFIVLQKIL